MLKIPLFFAIFEKIIDSLLSSLYNCFVGFVKINKKFVLKYALNKHVR